MDILFFDGDSGCARYGSLSWQLQEAPPVPIKHIRCIDYRQHRGTLRVSGGATRNMTMIECQLVKKWLESLAGAVEAQIAKGLEIDFNTEVLL